MTTTTAAPTDIGDGTDEHLDALRAERSRLAYDADQGVEGAAKALAAVERKLAAAERKAERAELAAHEADRRAEHEAREAAEAERREAAELLAKLAAERLAAVDAIASTVDLLTGELTDYRAVVEQMRDAARKSGARGVTALTRLDRIEDWLTARVARPFHSAGTIPTRLPDFPANERRLLAKLVAGGEDDDR